jgi:cytochrome c biogenesis protein
MKIFRSVRFNVGLFTVLALASAFGTFLPQRHEVPAKVVEFLAAHPTAGPWMDRAGLFNLFHSWWYVALLGLMAFDVVACKLRSFPKRIHAEDRLSEYIVATSPLKDRFEIAAPLAEACERVKDRLTGQGYRFREWRSDGEVHLWAAKHRLQRWGDFVLHVSIVAILVGALIGSLRGFEEFVPVTAGGERAMQNRPWTVAVDEFVVDFYKDTGTPRTFASQLRILDEGRTVAEKKIVVNDPLDVGGVRFYQASWGMTGMLRSATIEIPRREGNGVLIHVPRGERVPVQGTGLSVGVEMALPEFTITQDGRPDTRGLEPNNPAVLFTFYQEDKPVTSLWLLEREPHVAYRMRADQTVVAAAHPPFRLRHFEPILFSGLQVAYDPGVHIVGWGCVALLLGLGLHFYMHQRRLRILLIAGEGVTAVHWGGWSSRGAKDFEGEFRLLSAAARS